MDTKKVQVTNYTIITNAIFPPLRGILQVCLWRSLSLKEIVNTVK